jgi:hypothetical protein
MKESLTQGQTGARFEALMQEERREELQDIKDMIQEEDSSRSVEFGCITIKVTEQGKNLCVCVHYS